MTYVKYELNKDKNNLSTEWEFFLPGNFPVKLTPPEAKRIDRPEGSVKVVISANLFHLLLTNFDKMTGTN